MAKKYEEEPWFSSSIRVAKRDIKVWNNDLWARVREKDGISNDFLEDALSFNDFKPGGGKGGDLMAFTRDNRFIVKELNKGDHKSLMEVTESYVQHVLDGDTLLATFYVHFLDIQTDRKFVAMKNLLDYKGKYVGRFDLKGCADDKALEVNSTKIPSVHKRIWKLHMWFGQWTWSEERKRYYQGKKAASMLRILLTEEQLKILRRRLHRDATWLGLQGLMDYSLIVGIRKVPLPQLKQDPVLRRALREMPSLLRMPLIRVDGDVAIVLYIGIIDYLQRWSLQKDLAWCIKIFEKQKSTIPPVAYSVRFSKNVGRCFCSRGSKLSKSKRWKGITLY
eukprot:gnl/MRDRNA2_/MRDRNA2_145495_c0_seq1.p1 gnl/MRDRNA2_/MRDRNA2_145495_c0~~gnl/MRDRNA2_/MRDRNA2_145495_c0_seq1.p1  ORF type:complete len:335 (-),score=63.64 gnl/MRDRNA2_/MRDRNA2_145495_c0_seq1:119-1123(-)